MSRYIYTEFQRCIQCQGCEVACQREHDGQANVNVVVIENRFAVPIACRHCYQAACALVCPNDALESNGEEVIFNPEKCTGCKLCLLACPFGAMGFNSTAKVAAKCDLCEVRRSNGGEPACVVTCPSRALEYDDYHNHSSLKRRRSLSFMGGQPPLKGGIV